MQRDSAEEERKKRGGWRDSRKKIRRSCEPMRWGAVFYFDEEQLRRSSAVSSGRVSLATYKNRDLRVGREDSRRWNEETDT